MKLTPAILLWPAADGLITTGFLAAIAVICSAALTGRRGWWARWAIAVVACDPDRVREQLLTTSGW